VNKDKKTDIHWRRLSAVIPYAIAVVIILAMISSRNLLEPLELKSYDLKLRLAKHLELGKGLYTGRAVVVGMEEEVLLKEKPLIFWYPEIGEFISKMDEYGAKAVGIDIIPVHALGEKIRYAAESILDTNLDENYEEFLDKLGEVTDNSLLGPLIVLSEGTSIVQGVAGGTVPYFYPLMAFMGNVHEASVQLAPDRDGVVRKQMLKFGETDSFAHALYKYGGGEKRDIETVLINYLLIDDITYFSFTDVLADKFQSENFSGKIVLLGYITDYDDIHAVPLGKRIPGVTIHAAVVETLLSETSMRETPPIAKIFIVGTLCLVGIYVATRMQPLPALAVTFITIGAFLVLNLAMFYKGYLLNVFPNIFLPLTIVFVYPYRYLIEEGRKRKIYKTFSYYVDKKIIDSLIEKDVESLLKGEHKDVCIMFVDIRGFTAFSNENIAADVIKMLNLYFSNLTRIIHIHNGIIDKFIGDAVLAYFPPEANPIISSLEASKEILQAVDLMNEEGVISIGDEKWNLRIGIGLHFGSVIMGNIGSEKKMDFTIIGESVNIASRIEGLTKRLGHQILVSDTVFSLAKNKYEFKHLGKHEIRGVRIPVDIYTILY
jgi:class 3 adenylate cyclase/CHASE2 domain-containing sensor protein